MKLFLKSTIMRTDEGGDAQNGHWIRNQVNSSHVCKRVLTRRTAAQKLLYIDFTVRKGNQMSAISNWSKKNYV